MKRKSILFICPNPEGVAPSQRLKYEQYFDYFKTQGYDITVSSFKTKYFWKIVYSNGYYLSKVFWTIIGYVKRILYIPLLPFYDIVYIHLNVTPFGMAFFERIYLWLNPNVVFDIDDLVFIDNKSKVNGITKYLKSSEKYYYLFRKAKQVIVCTPFLKEIAERYTSHVTDISSTIDTNIYLPVNKYLNNKKLVLGWSGSHSTLRYFYLLKEVLLELKKSKDFEIVVFGVNECKIEGLDINVIPFSKENEVPALQRIDIGLYPLPLNEQWVYGKSGLKALQYMALGIPTIATKIAANLRIIKNEETGLLVKTDQEWLVALICLLDEPSNRERLGTNARKSVVDKYSLTANQNIYLNVLNEITNPSSLDSN